MGVYDCSWCRIFAGLPYSNASICGAGQQIALQQESTIPSGNDPQFLKTCGSLPSQVSFSGKACKRGCFNNADKDLLSKTRRSDLCAATWPMKAGFFLWRRSPPRQVETWLCFHGLDQCSARTAQLSCPKPAGGECRLHEGGASICGTSWDTHVGVPNQKGVLSILEEWPLIWWHCCLESQRSGIMQDASDTQLLLSLG